MLVLLLAAHGAAPPVAPAVLSATADSSDRATLRFLPSSVAGGLVVTPHPFVAAWMPA